MELMKDEKIIYETWPGKGTAIFLIIIGIITLILFIGAAFIIYGFWVLKIRYILTNKRLIRQTPFSSNEIRLEKIESMNVTWGGSRVLITWTGWHKIDVWGIKDWQNLVNLIHESAPKDSNQSTFPVTDNADELGKWHELMKKWVISKEEYERKKKTLL